jgi:hypothetical protein
LHRYFSAANNRRNKMNKFESVTKSLRWFMALLMVALVAGCGGGTSTDTPAPLSSAKAITSYTLAGPVGTIPGTIDESAKTVALTVPFGTDVTARVATFTTTGASVTVGTPAVAQVSGANGTANDFTNPVVYTVNAADGTTATYTVTVTAKTVKSIAVTPTSSSIPVSATQQFTATATYNDNLTSDVTMTATWTASTAGATVGLNTGLAAGVTANVTPVVITAALGGQQGTAALTVTAATLSSIAVTPASAVVAAGLTRQFTAMGTFIDSLTPRDVTTTASWTADSSGNASVGLHTGLATGVTTSATPVVLTATLGTKSATAALTVNPATLSSLAVSPASAVVAVGSTQQFQAIATYSDASSAVVSTGSWAGSWASASSVVATVDSTTGLATGVTASASAVGITATLSGHSATAALTVNAAAVANPTAPDLGEAGRFVILASQAVTGDAACAISNGDLGIMDLFRGSYAGFTVSGAAGDFVELTGLTWAGMPSTSYATDDANPTPFPVPLAYVGHAPYATTLAMINQARTDLGVAYSFLAAGTNPTSPVTVLASPDLSGLTLTRGVYSSTGTILVNSPLHLDAQGDANSVFIITTSGGITTGAGGNIVLDNSAQAKNVYWRSAVITTIAAGTTFYGNVFANTQVNVLAGANITGSLFGVTSQVTLISDTVTKAP